MYTENNGRADRKKKVQQLYNEKKAGRYTHTHTHTGIAGRQKHTRLTTECQTRYLQAVEKNMPDIEGTNVSADVRRRCI